MAQRRKFSVYLAGPMTGCNDKQKRWWRDEVKRKYGKQIDFRDPMDNLLSERAMTHEFVEADLEAIRRADGILVNMWRESIGSAIGIVHAHQERRPVAVANPNQLRNPTLDFYTDIMTDTPLKAAKALLGLLRAEDGWHVMKACGHEEPFRRRKIMDAVSSACRNAELDDIVIPRLVLPKVIDALRKSEKKVEATFGTRKVREEVHEALKALAADMPDAGRAAQAWQRRNAERDRSKAAVLPGYGLPVKASTDEVEVSVSSSKSHATIWGKAVKDLEDIPSSEARRIFRAIAGVPGITGITLGSFGHKEHRASCAALVSPSPTKFVIEGKLFDQGRKGTCQTFQVRIQENDRKDGILDGISARLKQLDCWAGET